MAYKKAFEGMTRTGSQVLNGQYKNFHTGEIVRFIEQPARHTVIVVHHSAKIESHLPPMTERWFVFEVNGEYFYTTRVNK